MSAHAADLSHLLSMTAVTHVGYPHWWHSHTVMWQNAHLPNTKWPGQCRTVSRVREGGVLGATLVSLDENSVRDALGCLCCRCFSFYSAKPNNPGQQTAVASSRMINQPREGFLTVPFQAAWAVIQKGSCCTHTNRASQ